jgi:hypothetical protein
MRQAPHFDGLQSLWPTLDEKSRKNDQRTAHLPTPIRIATLPSGTAWPRAVRLVPRARDRPAPRARRRSARRAYHPRPRGRRSHDRPNHRGPRKSRLPPAWRSLARPNDSPGASTLPLVGALLGLVRRQACATLIGARHSRRGTKNRHSLTRYFECGIANSSSLVRLRARNSPLPAVRSLVY